MSDLPRYPLIFNPNARSQKGRRTLRFLMTHAQRFALYASRSLEDAKQLTKKFVEDGEPVVVAAGGDGTLNGVVQELAGSKTALGVLPAGTMNVFARELGIPYNNLKKSLEVLDQGNIKEIDLFQVNGHAFMQMAGVGFDAQVIEETDLGVKKMIGPMAYIMAAVKVLGENPPKMRVTCEDGQVVDGVCVFAGNGSLYGGQLKLFSHADNADEMLDLLVFTEVGYKQVMDSLMGIATGAIDARNSSMVYLQSRSFYIECDREVPIEADGELIGRYKNITLEPAKRKLRVLAPASVKDGFFVSLVKTFAKLPRKNTLLPHRD